MYVFDDVDVVANDRWVGTAHGHDEGRTAANEEGVRRSRIVELRRADDSATEENRASFLDQLRHTLCKAFRDNNMVVNDGGNNKWSPCSTILYKKAHFRHLLSARSSVGSTEVPKDGGRQPGTSTWRMARTQETLSTGLIG